VVSAFPDRDDDVWLRDELHHPIVRALFTDDSDELRPAVRDALIAAAADDRIEAILIDTLDSAVEDGSDDTEASIWITVILGELRSRQAINTLLREFASDDESFQDVAGVALLRIGAPAVQALMDWLDEEPGRELRDRSYRLIGDSGLIDEPGFLEHVREFIRERIASERARSPGDSCLEEAVEACVRLGDRDHLDALRELRAAGSGPVTIDEAIEALEANEAGLAFVPTILPWEERYDWLLEDTGGSPPEGSDERGGTSVPLEAFDDDEDPEIEDEDEETDGETDLACLYRGIGSTGRPEEGEDLDARTHVAPPMPQDETDAEGEDAADDN